MSPDPKPAAVRINYYLDWSSIDPAWCYVMSIDGKHDHTKVLEAIDGFDDAEADVVAALSARWPSATIRRIDDVDGGAR